jgi:hypothetical protein
MKKLRPLPVLAGAILLAAGGVHAQKATELHIPVGRSPGLSGTVTVIGACGSVDPRERTVSVLSGAGEWIAQVTEDTVVYLDRSKLRLPSSYGTFADLRGGSLVEIKYRDRQRRSRGDCEWIKIQVAR